LQLVTGDKRQSMAVAVAAKRPESTDVGRSQARRAANGTMDTGRKAKQDSSNGTGNQAQGVISQH
jgi:hypothetical protein